jgi:hypothetical protein
VGPTNFDLKKDPDVRAAAPATMAMSVVVV